MFVTPVGEHCRSHETAMRHESCEVPSLVNPDVRIICQQSVSTPNPKNTLQTTPVNSPKTMSGIVGMTRLNWM